MHAHTLLVAAAALFTLSAAAPNPVAGAVTPVESTLAGEVGGLIPVPKTKLKCPATCGLLVMDQTENDYCHTSAYKQHLAGCLACAQTDGVWEDFKKDVVPVAKACGDDATPSPSSASSAPAPTGAPGANGAAFAAVADSSTSSSAAAASASSGTQPLPTTSAPAIAMGAASSLHIAGWLAAPALLAAALL